MEDFGQLLLPLAFIAILYLLLIRPQQKRRKEQQAMVTSLEVGDDVVTIGGLHGRVVALTDRTMDLEVTADSDVVLRFERGSLGRVHLEAPQRVVGDPRPREPVVRTRDDVADDHRGGRGRRVSERPDHRTPGDGGSDSVDDAAAQRRGTVGAQPTDLADPIPPAQLKDRAPSALTDPAEAIRGSAEAALLRGIDAADVVAEARAVALDAEARTGSQVDILTRLQQDEVVSAFIKLSDQFLGALGFTEHGFRHANLVGRIAHNVLLHLGADDELCELAAIGGYLHDVGNVVTRANHGLSGAWIAYDALRRLEVDPYRVGLVLSAIGNHEEQYGSAIGPVGAAVILADKSDVHRSRVRKGADTTTDIHDRVNDAVTHSFLRVDAEAATITLELELDTERSTVIEYFEIFLERMVMCRRAARTLGCEFRITANGVPLG